MKKPTLTQRLATYARITLRIIRGTFRKRVMIDDLTFDVSSQPAKLRGIDWSQWENENRKAIKEYIRPEDRVLELGGGIGIVSCFINKRLRDSSAHTVVEANPDLIPIIRRNGELNGCGFKVLNRVYGDSTFYRHEDFYRSSTEYKTNDPIQVQSLSPAEMKGYTVLVSDIEGMEIKLLQSKEIVNFERVIVEFDTQDIGDAGVQATIANLKTHRMVKRVEDAEAHAKHPYTFMVFERI
jgi:FkbM family methyltransferase